MLTNRLFPRFFPVAFLFLLLTACAELPPPADPDGQTPRPVTMLAPAGVFAASPDRRLIALGDAGLQLLAVSGGERRRLDERLPQALGWSRDGERLAAAFAGEAGPGQLVVYRANGEIVERADLPGVPVALAWSERDDLLVAGYRLSLYRFGANLAQWLFRITGSERTQIELADATLKPATALAVSDRLAGLLTVTFSPAGDELVVAQLRDPPQFPAYLQLTHRNWQSPGERKVLQLPLQPVSLAWGAAADTLLYRTGPGPWRTLSLWPPAGAVAPVTEPTDELPAGWGDGVRLQRFADGGYLLAVGARLYAGDGLPAQPPANDAEQGWSLRKWRFEGLITPEEYREVRL